MHSADGGRARLSNLTASLNETLLRDRTLIKLMTRRVVVGQAGLDDGQDSEARRLQDHLWV